LVYGFVNLLAFNLNGFYDNSVFSLIVALRLRGELAGIIFSCSAFFFFFYPSSRTGTTSAISSGFKLSSLGALSEPADDVLSPSV